MTTNNKIKYFYNFLNQKELTELFNLVEEVSIKLINNLDYQSGEFTIEWIAPILSSMPWGSDRKKNVNVNISFVLNNHIKN